MSIEVKDLSDGSTLDRHDMRRVKGGLSPWDILFPGRTVAKVIYAGVRAYGTRAQTGFTPTFNKHYDNSPF